MFPDLSKRQPKKRAVRFKAAAVLTAVLTCLLIFLLYLTGRPGRTYPQERTAALTRNDLLVVMTATTQRYIPSDPAKHQLQPKCCMSYAFLYQEQPFTGRMRAVTGLHMTFMSGDHSFATALSSMPSSAHNLLLRIKHTWALFMVRTQSFTE